MIKLPRIIHRPPNERAMRDFYSDLMGQGDLVFDVGANHGNRTAVFLALGTSVVAFEPQPRCAADLANRFHDRAGLTVVAKAVDEHDGHGLMRMCKADTISSMSDEWIGSVKESGRFRDYQWNEELEVETTTLDAAIAQYGTPVFIKIDVEGYEDHVVKGLHIPVQALSLEFTPEHMASTMVCLEHLSSLGEYEFNYCKGESMRYHFHGFVRKDEVVELLERKHRKGGSEFGDVYARLKAVPTSPLRS